MKKVDAFVGHSFDENDTQLIDKFLSFFSEAEGLVEEFSWDHAFAAEPKSLHQKVYEKMEGKNLFIGICTAREYAVSRVKTCILRRSTFKFNQAHSAIKCSDWVIQEIGFALGREMNIILFLEEGLRLPGGLQGDLEYITFTRENLSDSKSKFLQMLRSIIEGAPGYLPVKTEYLDEEIGSSMKDEPDNDPSTKQSLPLSWQLFNAVQEGDSKREEEIFQKMLEAAGGR